MSDERDDSAAATKAMVAALDKAVAARCTVSKKAIGDAVESLRLAAALHSRAYNKAAPGSPERMSHHEQHCMLIDVINEMRTVVPVD